MLTSAFKTSRTDVAVKLVRTLWFRSLIAGGLCQYLAKTARGGWREVEGYQGLRLEDSDGPAPSPDSLLLMIIVSRWASELTTQMDIWL